MEEKKIRKFKLRFIALVVVFIFVFSMNTAFADNDPNTGINANTNINVIDANLNLNTPVSVEAARNVAIAHIVGVMQNDDNSNWKSGVGFKDTRALFDLEGNISAYLFELKNQQGDDSGYIIVSASLGDNPIIEYSETGKSFIDSAIINTKADVEKKHIGRKVKDDDTKVYYLGGLSYLTQEQLDDNTSYTYDISTNKSETVDINELKKIKPKKNEDTQYAGMWKILSKNHLKQTIGGSTPPDNSTTFITDPSKYESGYSSSSSKDVTGYNILYLTTSDLGDGNNCGPTASVNLCEYWSIRNSAKYGKLIDNNLYTTFCSLEGYTPTGGVYDSKIPSAFVTYFKNKGLTCTSSLHYGTNSGADLEPVINGGNPFILCVHNNNMYGDHGVVGLGYKDFIYPPYTGGAIGITTHSIYIRIADGWCNDSSRFVWGNCAGTWNYVTVDPS